MAEFWWGKPSANAVRKHQHYYSACTGKCKPILHHMLQGLTVDDNPLIAQFQVKKEIEVIFEDEYLLVINKPHELLSVAGKEVKDSVYSRIKKKYPNATGPLIVHRLDMSTSGILLIAKNEIIHKNLQAQFINRTIKKRYVALLHGSLYKKNGEINLPLRVDLDDRPKQLVCYEHGKKALTKWEVIEVIDNKTKVYFYPITGRTHQLRVHAAHQLGLNIPIVGDDLYGTKANRLYLHAENLSFRHPISKKEVQFTSPAPF
ncbi:RluA family pseudouridine synthase [Tenacibaculum sp. HL-MS23]|uniref:RluA family pseudouridine synthase n=1 Tax=Tenacibaculum sp. HL-MS23 TaxID=3077734 RepID=UPI0028FC0B9A|nr:RluA family pseudouridine synthase [Tenacibaculum sp. HL-MS23]WNW02528.1 RluA family pseudouridine synthase [Tenacibaculum sp. HL-MS23]